MIGSSVSLIFGELRHSTVPLVLLDAVMALASRSSGRCGALTPEAGQVISVVLRFV